MLVAKQNLGPLAAIFFKDGRPRHENRRWAFASAVRLRSRRQTIDDQHLLPPISRQISLSENFRLLAQGRIRNFARLVRYLCGLG